MEQKIREKLEELRGYLQGHGGDLEIVDVDGKNVQLRLTGACAGCPHATMTIRNGIEAALRESIDSEISVEQVD